MVSSLSILPEPKPSGAGVHSRPLDSEDLRLIEEDLSKQLSSSPGDRDPDWDEEPEMEPYLTGLENGGTWSSGGQLKSWNAVWRLVKVEVTGRISFVVTHILQDTCTVVCCCIMFCESLVELDM